MAASVTALRAAEVPTTADRKENFLDVERLRLLSSASSRPSSTALRPASSTSIVGGAKEKRRLVPVEEVDGDTDADAPWIHVDKSSERRKRLLDANNLFQAGDAFDVYIDGARCLPDNVTLTKATVAALNGDRSPVLTENGSAFASLTSNTYNPSFGVVSLLWPSSVCVKRAWRRG